MPCQHKFLEDLNLDYCDKVETLIVGTFNPQWAKKNSAEWFYGREKNNFWYVLSKIYSVDDLSLADTNTRKKFCNENKIGITDLISCIKTADEKKHYGLISSFSDKKIEDNFQLDDLELVNIIGIIEQNPTIKNVYLTRSANSNLWKKIWEPIEEHCVNNSINCKQLLTPSNYAFFQFNQNEKIKHGTLPNFIYARWKEVWH